MKTPEKSTKPDSAKQKKQLLALGGLSAVFAAVLAIQFGGGEEAPEASAMTEPAADAADATSEAPVADAGPAATPIPVAKNNPVLEAPVADTAIKRSPFSNFWNVTPTGSTTVAAISAPTVTLNATMPGESSGLAVIDGELHFVGDSIQGWALASVGPRSVTLRAPTGDSVIVDMPLLVGKVAQPAAPAMQAPDGMPRDGSGVPLAPADG